MGARMQAVTGTPLVLPHRGTDAEDEGQRGKLVLRGRPATASWDSELSPRTRSQPPLPRHHLQGPSPPALGQSVSTQPVLPPDTWPAPAA